MLRVEIRDGEVQVSETPPPGSPPAGHVRVNVHSSSINGADARIVREATPDLVLPGIEFAGTIAELGAGVEEWEVGDRVMGLTEGGQAQQIVVDARLCVAVPDALPLSEAGALCEAFTTAHDALFTTGRLTEGDSLLITGAAGGVGIAAVQLGLAAGARVTASVRNEASRSLIDQMAPDVTAVAPDTTSVGAPYDVALELVGAPGLPDVIDRLATGGRAVVIGRSAGSVAQVDVSVLMAKRAWLTGSTLKHRTTEEKGRALHAMASVVCADLGPAGYRLLLDSTFPIEAAAEAYARFLGGGKLGKVLITMSAAGHEGASS